MLTLAYSERGWPAVKRATSAGGAPSGRTWTSMSAPVPTQSAATSAPRTMRTAASARVIT